MPFLRDHEIEQEAALLLAEYAREHQPVLIPPLPIEDIVELHLKLTFELMNLEQRCGHRDIHGAIWVNQQRIAIDKLLDPVLSPAKRGRYHFTLAHETGHWRLHRKYFLKREDRLLFDDATTPPDFIGRSGNQNRVEVQAHPFAANLLMPRPLVKQEWEIWHGSECPLPEYLRCKVQTGRRAGGRRALHPSLGDSPRNHPLDWLWPLVDAPEPMVAAHAVAAWPASVHQQLLTLEFLIQAADTVRVRCPQCYGHIEEVIASDEPGGVPQFYLPCPEIHRARIRAAPMVRQRGQQCRCPRDDSGIDGELHGMVAKPIVASRTHDMARVATRRDVGSRSGLGRRADRATCHRPGPQADHVRSTNEAAR